MIGLLKMPLSICQSGWKQIRNTSGIKGPEQRSRRCFANVTNHGYITPATRAEGAGGGGGRERKKKKKVQKKKMIIYLTEISRKKKKW